LSGFHERYSFPENATSDEVYWREYYLAVKGTNALVKAASQQQQAITSEILIACAIFTTIEILLGNNEAALRHLESGMGLLEEYLNKSLSHCSQVPHPNECSTSLPTIETKPTPRYDALTVDLIGFFARLDLQVHSLIPERNQTAGTPTSPLPPPPIASLPDLPDSLSTSTTPSCSLYTLIKHILHWIRHHATPYKHASDTPISLHETQATLLAALHTWKRTYLSNIPEETNWYKLCTTTPCEKAHLLLSYHLIFLKLLSALSPSESLYLTSISMRSFFRMMCYACVVMKQRNRKFLPVLLPEGKSQKEFYFSLESSIVEALYFTVLKCRHKVLRRCALGLLKCAGREGVWDGCVMATVAEHVIRVEEGGFDNAHVGTQAIADSSSDDPASGVRFEGQISNSEFAGLWGVGLKLDQDRVLLDMLDGWDGAVLVHEVRVDVDWKGRTVGVECEWFDEEEGAWRYKGTVLGWM
jgi:hypothetical protein